MDKLSKVIQFLRIIGLDSIAWSLRRLYCPVSNDALVLEVGSGGNPYFRSNVLIDAYEDTRERHWAPLVADRPTVLGYVENLPFKDKSFDFVIASHVLEHSKDPIKFISELQRVAKSGYIEVPDAFMERINPYHDHRLEVTVRNEKLIIRKKPNWQTDSELVEMYEDRVKKILTSETMRRHPFDFHVRYYWSESINYNILNPEVNSNWQAKQVYAANTSRTKNIRGSINQSILAICRSFLSQNHRNKQLKLIDILQCPSCGNDFLTNTKKHIECQSCNSIYKIKNNIPNMLA